jgi:hypothetical protein
MLVFGSSQSAKFTQGLPMIKVSVYSIDVRNINGFIKQGPKTGEPYNMDFQDVWVYTVDRQGVPVPHPQKVEMMLDHNKEGAALFYPAGDYTFAPNSVYVDRNGKMAFSPRLVALKKAAAPASAAA